MKFSPIFVVVLCLCGCSQEQVSLTSVSDFYEAFKNTVNLQNYSSREEISFTNIHASKGMNFDDVISSTVDREVANDRELFVNQQFFNDEHRSFNTDSNPEFRYKLTARHVTSPDKTKLMRYDLEDCGSYGVLWDMRETGKTHDGYDDILHITDLYDYDDERKGFSVNFSVRELPTKTINFSPIRYFRYYSFEPTEKIGSFKDSTLSERFSFFDLISNQDYFSISGNTLETAKRIPFVYNWALTYVDWWWDWDCTDEEKLKQRTDECSASIKLVKDGDYLSQIEFDVKTEKLNDEGLTLGFLNCSVKLSFSKINQTAVNPLTEDEIYHGNV